MYQKDYTMFKYDLFNDNEAVEQSPTGAAIGKIGINILHAAKIAFLIYSGVHAISASWYYAGNTEWQLITQVVGIVVTEATLFALYLALMNQRIQGAGQTIAAAITYVVGFILACLGIVADSQTNAGIAVSSWLQFYMRWLLPVAPAIMAAGALLTHALEPAKMRAREQANLQSQLDDERFRATIATQRAHLAEQRVITETQIASRKAALAYLKDAYTSDEAQAAIRAAGIAQLPQLLQAAGIVANEPSRKGQRSLPNTQQLFDALGAFEDESEDFLAVNPNGQE